MKADEVKQVLEAAGKMPAAKGRALVAAVSDALAAKDAAATDLKELEAALTEDLKPIGEALWNAYQAGDLGATLAGLKKVSAAMPGLAVADQLHTALLPKLAGAFLGEGRI
jgi:hypothetical protein